MPSPRGKELVEIGRATQVKKGQRLYPSGGRPLLDPVVRELLKKEKELAKQWISDLQHPGEEVADIKIRHEVRSDLMDRVNGKPQQAVQLNVTSMTEGAEIEGVDPW